MALSIGEPDRVEDPLDVSSSAAARSGRRWSSRRLALGLSPMPRSGLLLLIVGMALGPHGLRVLPESLLSSLDPAVLMAVVALGVLVGLEVRVRPPSERRLLGVASLDGGITILIVTFGMIFVAEWASITDEMPWLFALMLGICATPSSTPADGAPNGEDALAARVSDLDDVLPIVLSTLLVLWTQQGGAIGNAWLLVQGGLLAMVMAIAGWLLITQTSSENEQRVFVIGALLLLGGAAAHLSLSALFAGLVAGVFWNATGGPARDSVARDVRGLLHPLTVLLLVVVGARLVFSARLLGMVVLFIVLRIAAKLVSGWFAARASRELPGRGVLMSAPGVVGIAIALNVLLARGDAGHSFFAIVIAGSLGAELLSLALGPAHQDGRR